MAKPVDGQTVNIHYTGSLEDGTVFDSSEGRDPLQFTLGEGQVIPGFESAVRSLDVGESTKTTIPPEHAYGERREDMIVTLDRSQFPDDAEPQIGMEVYLQAGDQPIPASITDVKAETITLDANHRLAGQTLVFDIELVSVG
ncbi:MAG: FKBP-type peptidyl-prolyl cis-trans isomerase [Anaerolineae bacterium]